LHSDFHINEYIGILSQCQLPAVLAEGIEQERLNLSFPCRLKATAPRKASLWSLPVNETTPMRLPATQEKLL
jgi:hypothetical protein